MIDPSTGYDDEQDRLDRADEQIREQRWAEFVDFLKSVDCGVNPFNAMSVAADACESVLGHLHQYAYMEPFISFAETEGWDGVLCAIARAYREEQDAQKKKAES